MISMNQNELEPLRGGLNQNLFIAFGFAYLLGGELWQDETKG